MTAFLRAIEQYAIVLYALCVGGVLWSLRRAWRAARARRDTLYSLERETASAGVSRALLTALGFAALAGVVFLVTTVVTPALPPADVPTATPLGPLVTQTPTATPFPTPTPENTPTPGVTPNPTLAASEPLDTATPQPTAPPGPPAACPDPAAQITAPRDGETFSSPFQIIGTANISNFAFYKFELSGPATRNEFRTTGQVVNTPVTNGVLAVFDPAILFAAPGAYQFSLVVVDNVGNEAPHCTITLTIAPP